MSRFTSPSRLLRLTLLALILAAPVGVRAADAPAAATPAAPPKDPVVATVNGVQIHESDVEASQRELGPRAAQVPRDKIIETEETWILLNDAGRADKLQDDPAVKHDMQRAEDRVVARAYISKFGQSAVTDDAVKAKFDELVKKGSGEEEVKARHILVKTEADAKAIIAQLDKGADFAKLADQKSEDKGGAGGKGANGGDLGWFTKDKMVPEFSEAAFKLKKGEYTKTPVKSSFGWHVIKVEDRRAAAPPTFDEAKPQIQNELFREAFEARVKDLRGKAKIAEFNADGTPATPAPADAPPAAAPPKP